MRSISSPRERSAPRHYRGVDLRGDTVEGEFVGVTLVVAVKEDCLGCRSVFESSADAFGGVTTLLVAARTSEEPWWGETHHRLVISERLLADLDIRFPPSYVVIDAARATVVCEGAVFGPEQVKEEIAAYLM